MIRLILLLFISISCSHHTRYHTIEKSENKLMRNSIYRIPASDHINLNDKLSILTKCYENPEKVNISQIFHLGEKKYHHINYWITLANCLKELKYYHQSYHILKKTLTLAITQQEKEAILNNLLNLAQLQNNEFLAYNYLTVLSGYQKLSPLTLFNLGNYYLVSGNFLQALLYFQKAQKRVVGDLDINLALARSLIGLKRYHQAYQILKEIKPQYLQRSDIAVTYAYVLIKRNDLILAKKIISNINYFLKNEQEIAERYLDIIEQKLKQKNTKKS